MTAYVLVIVLAAGGHHQSFAVGYPKGRALLRPNGYGATKKLMANA